MRLAHTGASKSHPHTYVSHTALPCSCSEKCVFRSSVAVMPRAREHESTACLLVRCHTSPRVAAAWPRAAAAWPRPRTSSAHGLGHRLRSRMAHQDGLESVAEHILRAARDCAIVCSLLYSAVLLHFASAVLRLQWVRDWRLRVTGLLLHTYMARAHAPWPRRPG